jgi:SEC-C motif
MAKPGRNDLCPCGSGKKYKKCHESQSRRGGTQSRMLLVLVGAAVAAAIVAGIASFTGERGGNNVRVWDPAHGHYHDANGVQVP